VAVDRLAQYNVNRNEATGEDNRDGASGNRSWHGGAEGPTDDPAVNAPRARPPRNVLATRFVSQGVPMLRGGDEIGRTQRGNNNASCQDHGCRGATGSTRTGRWWSARAS